MAHITGHSCPLPSLRESHVGHYCTWKGNELRITGEVPEMWGRVVTANKGNPICVCGHDVDEHSESGECNAKGTSNGFGKDWYCLCGGYDPE